MNRFTIRDMLAPPLRCPFPEAPGASPTMDNLSNPEGFRGASHDSLPFPMLDIQIALLLPSD